MSKASTSGSLWEEGVEADDSDVEVIVPAGGSASKRLPKVSPEARLPGSRAPGTVAVPRRRRPHNPAELQVQALAGPSREAVKVTRNAGAASSCQDLIATGTNKRSRAHLLESSDSSEPDDISVGPTTSTRIAKQSSAHKKSRGVVEDSDDEAERRESSTRSLSAASHSRSPHPHHHSKSADSKSVSGSPQLAQRRKGKGKVKDTIARSSEEEDDMLDLYVPGLHNASKRLSSSSGKFDKLRQIRQGE